MRDPAVLEANLHFHDLSISSVKKELFSVVILRSIELTFFNLVVNISPDSCCEAQSKHEQTDQAIQLANR